MLANGGNSVNINIPGAQRRSSWLLPLVIGLILVEFWIIVKVATYIGVAATIMILLCTSLIGASLTRSQWQRFALRIQSSLTGGVAPENMLSNTLGLLLAGIFLLIPGFLTDLIGLALLIPPLRHAVARRFMKRAFGGAFTNMGAGQAFGGMSGFGQSQDGSGPTFTVHTWSSNGTTTHSSSQTFGGEQTFDNVRRSEEKVFLDENGTEIIDVTPNESDPTERGPSKDA